jgi:small basic protein (TIGR04137 family)
MSVHRSLKGSSLLARSRNVFKRIERLEQLEKAGRRQKADSVYGLPKVRTRFKVKKVKGDPKAEKAEKPEKGAAPGAGAAKGAAAKPAAAKPEAKKDAAKK